MPHILKSIIFLETANVVISLKGNLLYYNPSGITLNTYHFLYKIWNTDLSKTQYGTFFQRRHSLQEQRI